MSHCVSVTDSEIARFRAGVEVETDDLDEPRTCLQFSANNVGNEKFSLLIVSTQNVCDRIKSFMSEIVSQKFNGNIVIKLAESIEQILDSGISYTTIDYIVIIFDTSRKNNIKKLHEELLQIENSYIATRRLCFVNGSPKSGMKGSDLEIVELAQRYNLHFLNGHVSRNDSCKRLCERILGLVTSSCGFSGGVPFIMPTSIDVFLQLFT